MVQWTLTESCTFSSLQIEFSQFSDDDVDSEISVDSANVYSVTVSR